MENENLPTARAISYKFDKDNSLIFKVHQKINIESNLKNRNPKLLKLLSEKLDDQLVIYDESLKLIISIHELCKQHFIEKHYAASFIVLSAKMVSLMLGIRQMLYSGLSDCVKNLNRPLIETLDVFQACLSDTELNNSFSRIEEKYDNNEFYFKNFSKGKLDKQIAKLYEKLLLQKDDIKYLEERKKANKTFLSESIHSSYNASFSSYLMLTLDLDIENNIYGKITIGYPRLLVSLIEEIFIFNNILRMSIEKDICSDFENISNQSNFPIYKLYSEKYELLCDIYLEKLHKDSNSYSESIAEIRKAFEENNNA